jgi:hypothetical protein
MKFSIAPTVDHIRSSFTTLLHGKHLLLLFVVRLFVVIIVAFHVKLGIEVLRCKFTQHWLRKPHAPLSTVVFFFFEKSIAIIPMRQIIQVVKTNNNN